jgi:hypothetical protein
MEPESPWREAMRILQVVCSLCALVVVSLTLLKLVTWRDLLIVAPFVLVGFALGLTHRD